MAERREATAGTRVIMSAGAPPPPPRSAPGRPCTAAPRTRDRRPRCNPLPPAPPPGASKPRRPPHRGSRLHPRVLCPPASPPCPTGTARRPAPSTISPRIPWTDPRIARRRDGWVSTRAPSPCTLICARSSRRRRTDRSRRVARDDWRRCARNFARWRRRRARRPAPAAPGVNPARVCTSVVVDCGWRRNRSDSRRFRTRFAPSSSRNSAS